MFYISTRGRAESVSGSAAIITGMAPDGGLYVPGKQLHLNSDLISGLEAKSYVERALAILQPYLPEFDRSCLQDWLAAAYSRERFAHPAVVPLHRTSEKLFFQELWHGPTAAFKDLALQLLPYLLTGSAEAMSEKAEIAILVATSGDTGKAALEGFRDVPGTRVIVFFPEKGVSTVQKRQMITQEGQNVHVAAVRGNFDDAQSGVKEIFGDPVLGRTLAARGFRLSSANSINWGRLVPQITYYFSAYLDLVQENILPFGSAVNFVVPTGNFGNIMAGFYARRAGLPLRRLICATNTNDVLTRFIRGGAYDAGRPLVRTASPSMDILISSNLERLLFELTGNAARVRGWMGELAANRHYTVDASTRQEVRSVFWSDRAGEAETTAAIARCFRHRNYLIDPHTAVGLTVYGKYVAATADQTPTVILSTASPFKFNESVARSILEPRQIRGLTEEELLEVLAAETGQPVPAALRGLNQKPVLHHTVVGRHEMKETVLDFLK